MYVVSVPNRSSPPAILLRESYRENGKVKNRTIANLTSWHKEKIDALKHVLKGGAAVGGTLEDMFEISRSIPHGHVACILGTLRSLKFESMLDRHPCWQRDYVVAMIVSRIFNPQSKLATSRAFHDETLDSTLGKIFHLEDVNENKLYEALDWLLLQQKHIERMLAKKHLQDTTLVMYDVTSTYFEGRKCPIAKFGYNRDGKRDKLQIVVGLLTNKHGCPIAVEVFEGNTADPKTLQNQIEKCRKQFGLKRVVIVGDRGILTSARIQEELQTDEALDWISALRAPAIKELLVEGHLQLTLFDKINIAEIISPEFPDERLIACRNPDLAEERKRKRQELLVATEKKFKEITEAVERKNRPLKGADKIGQRVGKIKDKYKMAKHFILEISEDKFTYIRNEAGIAQEEHLDGFYVIRTSLKEEDMVMKEVVKSYKDLSKVERAFRSLKTVDLHIRPIYHHRAKRVRAHVFLCMLAYYIEWNMRQKLAPIIFDDHEKVQAESARQCIVEPACRSDAANEKAKTKRTSDDFPVHSFRTLLTDMATICVNYIKPKIPSLAAFKMLTTPTNNQQRVLNLLGVNPASMMPM